MIKLFTVVFAVFLFFYTSGYETVLTLMIASHTNPALRQEGKEACITILDESQMNDAVRHNAREISYQGIRYDIKDSFLKNGHKFYRCVKDEQEQELIEQLASASGDKTTDTGFDAGKSINRHLSKHYSLPDNNFTLRVFLSAHLCRANSPEYNSPDPVIPLVPPRTII